MTKLFRAAVIGLGIGSHHAAAYAGNPHIALAALCDADPDRLAGFLERYPTARGYAQLEEMLARESPDLVSICTPDWLHADMAIAALQAGAHVVCTKPLTTTVEDARRLLATADAAGRHLMAAHERRFHPRYRAIKRVLDQGLLGDLFYIEIDYFTHKGRQFARTPWYKSAANPRAPILGTGAHAVDLLRWYGGEVETAWGIANHIAWPEFPTDDCMLGIFRLAGGAIGKVTQTYASLRGAGEPDLRITIHGTKGAIEDDKLFSLALLDDAPLPPPAVIASTAAHPLPVTSVQPLASSTHRSAFHIPHPALEVAGRLPWRRVPPVEQDRSSHHLQLDDFVTCLLDGRPPQPDGREGARTVAACLAVIEAARTGRPVRPEPF